MSLLNLFIHQTATERPQQHVADELTAEAAAESASRGAVLVALTGEPLDREMMSVACAIARARKVSEVHAVYAVEVPRNFLVTDELPEARSQAEAAFERASADAAAQGIAVIREYVQSRDTATSLAQLAREGCYSLLVIGLPRAGAAAGLEETVDGVLRCAPCRVWVVRDAPIAA